MRAGIKLRCKAFDSWANYPTHENRLDEAILMSTHNICFYTYVVGTHENRLDDEAILMSTHNICFYGALMKIILQLSSTTLLICSTDDILYLF